MVSEEGATTDTGSHYILYWQERSVLEHASNDLPLDVVASNQLFRVLPGDTIWIVTLSQERDLFLAGRLVVGDVVEYEEAVRRMPDAGLWQGEYYAFPEPGTEEFLRPVSLMEVVEEIRFDSADKDRPILRDGQVNPQQLQSMRKLTLESAELLETQWYTFGPFEADELDPEAMLNVLQQTVELMPEDPTVQYNYGVALGRNGRDKEAVEAYKKALELGGDALEVNFNLGATYLALGRHDEAIAAFNKTILAAYEYAPAHFMLGVAYFESGRYDEAVAATRQGLEICPDDPHAYYNIAYWAFKQGKYRGAMEGADRVLQVEPTYTKAAVLKGRCFRELRELEHEIDAYRKALDIGMDLDALFFLGAAWERKIAGSDAGIEYVESNGTMELQDPVHQFCFAMGNLALGVRDNFEGLLDELRPAAPDLLRRLEFAIRWNQTRNGTN